MNTAHFMQNSTRSLQEAVAAIGAGCDEAEDIHRRLMLLYVGRIYRPIAARPRQIQNWL